MNENPVTMEEWQEYVNGILTDEELFDVAKAAGSLKFGQKLLEEGYLADDVSAIHKMLAFRLAGERVAPPGRVGSCQIDYRAIVPTGTFTF